MGNEYVVFSVASIPKSKCPLTSENETLTLRPKADAMRSSGFSKKDLMSSRMESSFETPVVETIALPCVIQDVQETLRPEDSPPLTSMVDF